MSELLKAMEEVKVEKKLNRHVGIAMNHMNQRLQSLIEKRAGLTVEIEQLQEAIEALK